MSGVYNRVYIDIMGSYAPYGRYRHAMAMRRGDPLAADILIGLLTVLLSDNNGKV